MATKEVIRDLWCCTDCVLLIANGELPEDNPDYDPEAIERNWPDYHLVCDGPHEGEHEEADTDAFSWSECDACSSRLGGSRHRIAAIPR